MNLGDKIALLLTLVLGPLLWSFSGHWQLWATCACLGLIVAIWASAGEITRQIQDGRKTPRS
jgi:hypothetical protein